MTQQERSEAIEFLRRDGWIISAVEHTDVPRVMVEFAKLKLAEHSPVEVTCQDCAANERDWKQVASELGCEPTREEILKAVRRFGCDAATETRWQDAIYEKLKLSVGPDADSLIDGGGTDSGDALDFTLAEIGQALAFWQEKAESKLPVPIQPGAPAKLLQDVLIMLAEDFGWNETLCGCDVDDHGNHAPHCPIAAARAFLANSAGSIEAAAPTPTPQVMFWRKPNTIRALDSVESRSAYVRDDGQYILIGHDAALNDVVGIELLGKIKQWAASLAEAQSPTACPKKEE